MKLTKTYNPGEFEPNIYQMWEASNSFKPSGEGEPYGIVLPPANANGNLHIGHALTIGIEDILARYYRMKGRDVIYIPGEDHAGLETWVVYEWELEKKGHSRLEYSREENYRNVRDFVNAHRHNTEGQIRALGASVSWEHLVYTLDKKVVDRTYKTFKKLWDEKMIYRGERIVNYSTKFQTGYADIEVKYKTEKGTLWKIAYPVLDHVDEIVVATTRPETLLGDTAVAVHPDDERYKHLIGSHVVVPITNREVPVVADDQVDPKFGTGAVKVTPSHDPNDFEIARRHNLEHKQVIDFNGKMINVPDQFAGLTTLECRKRLLGALQVADLLRGEETIEHAVGYDYKSNLPIEPLPKEQWFMKMGPLAERAIEVIKSGEIKFYPESKKAALLNYLEKLHDWNLSRQIPWGIPIPAFVNENDPNDWIYDERVTEKTIDVNGTTYKREEDTFDTWFSSGQWPFITTDYLEEGSLSKYYPLDVMETGHDILYPWVSRMIMFGLYVTDQLPFKEVYLHGLVMDKDGQKMSKSKGNVINPMDMVIKHGSDALRLGLVASRSPGQNQAFGESRVVTGRNFCNKLWNIARYIENVLPDDFTMAQPHALSLADHWIIRQLNNAADTVGKHIENYRFADASEFVYHTIWDDVADWYVESSKKELNLQLLGWVLDTSLRLTHPFAPFVSEAIWQTLGWHQEPLITSRWPEKVNFDEIAAAEFDQLRELVVETRYVMSELPKGKKYTLLYHQDSLVQDNAQLIQFLANLGEVRQTEQPKGLRLAAGNREAWLELSEETLYEHQSNLERRLAEAKDDVLNLQARLDNKTYLEKAPANLVEETRQQLADRQAVVDKLERELKVLD